MRPRQSLEVLETLKKFSSAPLFRKGVRLKSDDNQTVIEVYQCWMLLLIDLGYLTSDTLLITGRKIWIDITHNDVYEVNNAFAECLQLVRCKTNKGFKALCSSITPHLHSLLKKDMLAVIQDDVVAARRLVQIFSWTSRLSLRHINLKQQLLQEYRDVEENIPLSFPASTVTSLNVILRRWLTPYCPFPIHPQHGPGAISEMKRNECCPQFKYEQLKSDAMLRFAFGDEWWVGTPDQATLDRTSRTIFVPKSYKTFRTISAEPASLQYFQQGVRKAIDQQIQDNAYLRHRLGLHDQERNMRLAREGSISRNYATLDLTSASDSVSYNLVKQIFRGTWLYRYLICTRSTQTVLPDNTVLSMRKFAPMGSALCFPVETLIFAAVCELVTRDHRAFGDYSVYGDDIIVPTKCAQDVIEVLEALGFKINKSKSFIDDTCWFRESCGGEYCDGFDVTPIKVSRKYASVEKDVRLSKLITLANRAYTAGYRNLRYFFLQKMKEEKYVPLFAPTALLSDNYTNYHTESRWNEDLQRTEYKAHALLSRVAPSEKSEDIRYRHWMESTADRITASDLAFTSRVGFTTMRFKMVWLPLYPADNDNISMIQ